MGGRGQGADGGWFVPGAGDGWAPPWGRRGGGGAAAAAAAAAGERETLAVVMARRAPPPSAIRRDAVRVAEAAAGEVLLRVHPTREAERRRQDVIAYLRRLIGSCLGCEVRCVRACVRPRSDPSPFPPPYICMVPRSAGFSSSSSASGVEREKGKKGGLAFPFRFVSFRAAALLAELPLPFLERKPRAAGWPALRTRNPDPNRIAAAAYCTARRRSRLVV